MASKKKGEKGKGVYLRYKNSGKFSINKKKKIQRHIKKHPGDEVAKKVNLSNLPWKRRKPGSRVWKRSKDLMQFAHMLRKFGYRPQAIHEMCFRRKTTSVTATTEE